MKLTQIFEQVISEDFKSQAKRYIGQGIEPDIVNSYIEKFKHIRDKKFKEMFSPDVDIEVTPEQRNNIDAYKDFHDLEVLVDYVAGRRQGISNFSPNNKPTEEEIEVTGKPIYKDERFEVFYADTPRACIKYKGKFPYSWCIARSDSSNMFYTYRFKPYEPAFYFIKDLKATEKEFGIWNMTKNVFQGTFKNKYHFFVIQVPKNIDMEDNEQKQYIVSSANNDGDTEMSWNEILKINPKLAPIKGLLEPKPFTPEERRKNERFKNGIDDHEFKRLSYEDKRSYLDIYPTIARPITTGQFKELPEDLMNLYVSFGIGLDDEQFAFIKNRKDILKRYTQISKRKLEEYLKRDKYDRRMLRMAYTELVILSDSDVKSYLDTLDAKEINRFVKANGEDKLDMLEKHLPHKFTTEHRSIRTIIAAAKAGDEQALAKLQDMVPDDVEVAFYKDKIIFHLDTYGYSYLEKNVDSSVWEVYDKLDWNNFNSGYGDIYFDDEENKEEQYIQEIKNYIQGNPQYASTFKSYGLPYNKDTVSDMIETYDLKDRVLDEMETAFSNSKEEAEDDEWRRIRDEIVEIASVNDTRAEIGIGPFLMYLTHHGLAPDETLSADGKVVTNSKTGERFGRTDLHGPFFTTDRTIFINNMIGLLDGILEDYDVPDNMDRVYEKVSEAGYGGDVDHDRIYREISDAIDTAISKFADGDEEPVDDANPNDKENLAKLKSQIIANLNNTLKGLGQDPFASEIENNLVKISIDRGKFHLDGKVYVKLFDKTHNQSHEGYVFIKDIPNYFNNHSLFEHREKIERIRKLIRY